MTKRSNRFVRTKQFWHTKALCPHCGQPMPQVRRGARLTPLKGAIFDMIESRTVLTWQKIQKAFKLPSHNAVRSHIHEINGLITNTGWRIEGGTKHNPGYRLVKEIPR